MTPGHLTATQGPRRSCLCRTKGQAKPRQDELFQLCRALGHRHVHTQPKESGTGEARLSLMGTAAFGMFTGQS